jgi:outer membrane scaffolding protein for murein synthesis (MipA/OmpV family)
MVPGRRWTRNWQALLACLTAVSAAQASEVTPLSEPATPREEKFEGAVGLILTHKPTYLGSSTYETQPVPAGFLRWGRITITGAGGFTTKRKDDVERGLGAELVRREHLRMSLNLRYDNGRSDGDSPELAGMGDIKRTVRARLSVRWNIDDNWQFTSGLSVDTLNRVGGYLVDATLVRQWQLAPRTIGRLGVGLTAASDRYMQAWHGVTPEQSVRTGYPVFSVPEGLRLRDVSVSGVLRHEFTPRWAGFAGLSHTRVLGPAADSPLTGKVGDAVASAGLVWRF